MKIALVVPFPSTINSAEHESSNNEVKESSEYSIIECLSESMLVPRLNDKGSASTGT
jgi:hypothetical protein